MPLITSPAQIPDLVKHVTLAILAKNPPPFAVPHSLIPTSTGSSNEKFIRCLITAVNGLKMQGYLTFDSEAGPNNMMALTGKGVARNKVHAGEWSVKSDRFDRMYRSAFDSNSGPEQKKEPEDFKKDPAKVKAPPSKPRSSVKKEDTKQDIRANKTKAPKQVQVKGGIARRRQPARQKVKVVRAPRGRM